MAAEAVAVASLPEAPKHLRRGLRRLRRRVRMLLALRLATYAVAGVAGVAMVAVVLCKLRDVWFSPYAPELGLAAAAVGGCLAALIWPLPDALIAASADRRLGLRDRLGTALQLVRGLDHTGMEEAMVCDALEHVQSARSGEAFPCRVTRATKVAGVLLLLLGAAQVLPIPAWLLSPQQQEDRAFLKREAARIEPVAKKLEEEAKRAGAVEAQEAAKKLQLMAKEFKKGQLDRKHALLKLDEADKELERVAQRLAPPPPKTAAQAAEEMQQAAQRTLASRAENLARQAAQRGDKKAEEKYKRLADQARKTKNAEQLKQLAQQLAKLQSKTGGNRGLPADLMAQLSMALSAEDWDKLSELMDSLDKLPQDLSKEELAQLEKELRELAKALENTDLNELSKCLGEACSSCKSGNCKLSAAALRKALAAYKRICSSCKLAKSCRGCKSGTCMGIGPGDSQGKLTPGTPGASLYAPRDTKTDGSYAKLPGQIKPGGQMLTTTEQGAPEKSGNSQVPYYEVIGEYSKAAEEALSKEDVPAGYRGTVREYFQSLEGESGTRRAPAK
jgi:chemotaxis protein histidine kinase CheA